jgi:hypothetical protein
VTKIGPTFTELKLSKIIFRPGDSLAILCIKIDSLKCLEIAVVMFICTVLFLI